MFEILREELGTKFLKYGLTEETLKLSQELDHLILEEQIKIKNK